MFSEKTTNRHVVAKFFLDAAKLVYLLFFLKKKTAVGFQSFAMGIVGFSMHWPGQIDVVFYCHNFGTKWSKLCNLSLFVSRL